METKNYQLITIKQLTNHVYLSVSTINRLLASGDMVQPDYLVGLHKKRLWKLESINKWLNENCVNPKKHISCN